MKNIKKIFALLLTCTLVFSALSGAIFTNTLAASAPAVDSSKYVRIEAESSSAYTPQLSAQFEDPDQLISAASNSRVAGNINCDYNKIQTFDSLSTYLDKSNTPTVTFTVNAPEAGDYNIIPGYLVNNASKWNGHYFMSVLVNDHDAYKCYLDVDADSTSNKAGIDVTLSAGTNIIRLIPFVADTKQIRVDGDWINIDYLDVDKNLTPVAINDANTVSVDVENAEYKDGFSNTAGSLSGDRSEAAKNAGITADNFTNDDLSKVSYFAYTFDVARTGYYNINLTFNPGAAFVQDQPRYYGYIVNGVPMSAAAARRTNNQQVFDDNIIDLTARLRAGKNTIVVTNNLLKNDSDANGVTATAFDKLTIFGNGVSVSGEQLDPTTIVPEIEYTVLPAETYASQRGYDSSYRFYGPYMLSDSTYVPTFDELQAGTLDKSAIAYVSYHVKARTAGTYSVAPYITCNSTASDADLDNYFFIVSVNDKKYYRIDNIKKSWDKYPIDVELESGINVIRCIPFCKDTYNLITSVGSNQMSLYVQNGLRGVKSTDVTVNGADAAFKNLGKVQRTYLTVRDIGNEKNFTNFVNGGLTFDTVKQESLDKLSYIAHTFEVPENGYYDMTFGYNVVIAADRQNAGSTGYFVARIDGKKYKVNFYEPAVRNQTTESAANNAANLSTYLTKGTHTILVSAAMDWKCPGQTDSAYHTCFLQYITVSGGMKVADTQINPVDIADEVTTDTITSHLEAEIFGDAVGFEKPKATGLDGYSARGAVSGIKLDSTALQSKATIEQYFDKSNNAYVTFTVNANADGEYDLYPVYRLKNATAGYSMTVLVNDDKAYDSPFAQDASKEVGWNNSTVKVALKKGINVIRLVPYIADNASLYSDDCIDIDYLGIGGNKADDPNEPVIGVLPQTVTVNAGNAAYKSGFNIISNGLAGMGNSMENAGLTIDTINNKNLSNAAYFAYTVNAATDGYYDISLPFSIGGKNDYVLTEKDYNFALYTDGSAVAIPFNVGGRKTANASTYLTAGDHTLVFIAQLPKTSGSDYKYGWTDFSTVTFSGGLTISDNQDNPIKLNRLEAEVYGETSTYDGKEAGGTYSGGYVLGGGYYGYDNLVTRAEMEKGNYDPSQANVSFKVTSEQACQKQFAVMYYMDGSNRTAWEHLDDSDKRIHVYVKNSNGIQHFLVKPGEWVTADWVAGENTVITTLFDKETYDKYASFGGANNCWVNIDYIDLDDGLVGKKPKATVAVRLEAEEYAERFSYPGTEQGGSYSGGAAVSNGGYGYNSLKTREEYMSGDYVGEPYLIYTVNAERTGDYSMAVGFKFGTGGNRPSEIPVYLIVKNLSTGTVTAYRQPNNQNWVDGIHLTEGINEVVVTIFDAETYAACGAKGANNTWMNMDYIDLYSDDLYDLDAAGLEYSIKGQLPEAALPEDSENFTRLEAETVSFPNYYWTEYGSGTYSGKFSRSPEKIENAQSFADLTANGLDERYTPFTMYTVTVPTEGDYNIRVGMGYKATGNCIPVNYKGYGGIFVNDQLNGTYEFDVTDNRSHIYTYTATVHLNAGVNTIKTTAATSDSIFEVERTDNMSDSEWSSKFVVAPSAKASFAMASLYVYQDYLDIDVAAHVTTTTPANRMEAEDAMLRGYSAADRSASGGKMACNEDFSRIITSGLTLDKLNSNPDYLVFASYVQYEIIADAAGRYPVSFIGTSGKSGSPLSDDVFFGLSVNGGKFDKLEYRVSGGTSHFSRVAWLDLNEGSNTVTITCILKDIIRGSGNLYYIDHDCIMLSEGLHGVQAEIIPAGDGDEFMEVTGHLTFANTAAKIKPASSYYVDSNDNRLAVNSFRVRVNDSYDRDKAETYVERLAQDGIKSEILYVDDELYVVYAGSFNTMEEAEAEAVKIKDAGYGDATAKALKVTYASNSNNENGNKATEIGNSPLTGENLLLVIPMILALAGISFMYAFFKKKSKKEH